MISETIESIVNLVDGVAEKRTVKIAEQCTTVIMQCMKETVYNYFFIVNNTKYDGNTSIRFRNKREVDDAYNEIISKNSNKNKEPLSIKDLEIDYNGDFKIPEVKKLEEEIVNLEVSVSPNDGYIGVSLNVKFINIKNNYTEQLKFPIIKQMPFLIGCFMPITLDGIVEDSLNIFLFEMFGRSQKVEVYNRVKNSYYENPYIVYAKN